jgi:hypothetical protein
MEGIFFLLDILCMVILALAIFRAERKSPPGDLGLFAYKPDRDEGMGKGREDA